MKIRAAKKAAAEDEAKSMKIRSSRDKRRRGRRSRSPDSDSPARKRSKKKIADKKSKRKKATSSRRRHRSPSSSPSYSHRSCSTCHGSSSASGRSVSPPPKSRSRDARKEKGRGMDREKDWKRRRTRRSRSYFSSSTASSGSSQSRSRSKSKSKNRKRRVAGMRDDASKDRIVQDNDNCHDSRTEMNWIEDVDRDEEAVAVAKKGENDIDGSEKNVGMDMMESLPPSKDANETGEILPAGSESPEAVNLELILRQKALENFRKFRGEAVIAAKTNKVGASKEVVRDSPRNTVMEIAEARPAAITPLQRQGSSLGVGCSARSPRLNDSGNNTSPLKVESSRGISHRAGSPGIIETVDTCSPIEQQRSGLEVAHPTSQIRLQDGRNSGSVMQRLGSLPRTSATVKERISSSVASRVNGAPKVRSVVSIPTREGLDGGTFIMSLMPSENSAPVEISSEVRHPPTETEKTEGTSGDDKNTGNASTPNGIIPSTAEGNSLGGIDGKDGSQFEKKTFARMHDGETVQVSYKVYIPKKNPALARRKLQR